MARKNKTPANAAPGTNIAAQTNGDPNQGGQFAPWPSVDKYPNVIGSGLTLQYISSVFRSAQTGYRREYVDVLDELIERDPNAFAVLSQRILAVAGGKLSMVPAKCDEEDEEKAKEIADDCEQAIHGISHRRQSLASLLWGIYYGVSAAEINWGLLDGKWSPSSLSFIHSRRLAYPDPFSWSVKIWDLGMLQGWGIKTNAPMNQTQTGFGLSPYDFPGKFIVHTPQLRGDYPTRDGLGREMAYWMAIKGMGARNFAAFIERFGKPWPIGYYATTKEGKDLPRAADDDDKKILEQTLLNIGAGNLNAAALPNSVCVDLTGPTSGTNSLPSELPQEALIRVCDSQIAKAVLGQSDTSGDGKGGARSSTQVRKDGTIELYRYDAACLCDTLKRDLVEHYVHLNYPGFEHLCPTPHIDVEPPPDRKEESEIILNMVTAGAPLDADDAGRRTDLKLIPNPTEEPRRLFLNKGADNPSFFDAEPVLAPGTPDLSQSPDAQDGTDPGATADKKTEAKPGVTKPANAAKKTPKGKN